MNNRMPLLLASALLMVGVFAPSYAQEGDARKYCPDGDCYEIGRKPKKAIKLYDVVHVMRDAEIPRTASGARKQGFYPQDKLQDAIDRVKPGGEVLLHKGEYVYDTLALNTRRPFTIRAYTDPTFGHIEPVTLLPTVKCLEVAPIFNETLPPPIVTIGEMRIVPQSLAGESCIDIENATLTLRNVEIDLSAVQNKRGVRVRSGKLIANGSAFKGAVRGELTNEGVAVDPDAAMETKDTAFLFLKIGAHILRAGGIAATAPRTVSQFTSTGFASNITGILVDGAAEVAGESQFNGNDVGIVVSGAAKIENTSFQRNGVGVQASGALSGDLIVQSSNFDGDDRVTIGVEVRAPDNADIYAGLTRVSASTFIGLERAISASASIAIGPENSFGPGSSTGMAGSAFARQRNNVAIAISGNDIFSFYDIQKNIFNENNVSLSIADNFVGELVFLGNIGEQREGSRRKNIPPNNILQLNNPETVVIDPCKIGTTGLDAEIAHKKRGLGQVRNCNQRR